MKEDNLIVAKTFFIFVLVVNQK